MMKRCLFIIVSLLASLMASAEQYTRISEPKVIVDDLEFNSYLGKYCHRSGESGLWGPGAEGSFCGLGVDAHLSTQLSELMTLQVGVGLCSESNIQEILTQETVTLSEGNKAWYSPGDIVVSNTIPDGNYRFVLVYREKEEDEWVLCGNSSEKYVEVSISENWLVSRCFPLSEEEQNTIDYGLNVIDGINYNIYSVYGRNEAVVYSLGTEKYDGDVYIPDSVKFDDKYYTVTKAVSDCFVDCPNMTSLSLAIPEINSIYDDKNLQKLELREGVTSFIYILRCDSLESLDLPKSLSQIHWFLAKECKSLKTIRFNNPKQFFWEGGEINWGKESLPALSDVYFAAPEPPEPNPSLGLNKPIHPTIHPTAVVHVPEGRKTVYENAGWKGWNIVDDQPLPEADGIEWGYCSGDIVDHLGLLQMGGDDDVEFAIHAPSEALLPYKGKQISAIEFYDRKSFWDTGEDPEMPDYVFVTTSGTDYLIKQTVTDTRKGWNKITLETPYTITGEELFVGIGRHQGLQTNFTDLNATAPDGFWLRFMGTDDGGGQIELGKWYNKALQSTDFNHPITIRFTIAGDDLPYDVVLEKVQLYANGMLLNTPTGENSKTVKVENGTDEGMILMTAKVKSRTKEIIRNYTINWQIDGQQTGSKTIKTSLPANSIEPISIEIPASLVNRDHVFTYSVTDINGHADAVAMNSSGSIAFRAQGKQYFPRKVVMEEGTGTWCGWCPEGMAIIDKLQRKYPDHFIAIGIHDSDEMGNAENYNKILQKFQSLPRCFINRTMELNPRDFYGDYIDEVKDFAECQISASAEFADPDSTVVIVSTESVFGFSDEDADIRIVYVVVEDHVGPYVQVNYCSRPGSGVSIINYDYEWQHSGPEVETVFNSVARGIYNGVDGVKLSVPSTIVESETYQYQYKITLPKNIQNKKNIRIITLLIDNKSGEILNADSYDMVEDDDSANEPNASGFEFRYNGKSLKDGATIIINAEKDESGNMSWTTNPDSNPRNKLILATLDGNKQLGEAMLEVQKSSFPSGIKYGSEDDPFLHWYMEQYKGYIKPEPGDFGDLNFVTDNDGVAMVQFSSRSIHSQDFLDVCITAAINGIYKMQSVNVKFIAEEETAIKTIRKSSSKTFDVYSLNGVKLRSGVTSLDGLPRGLYIVNGRKVVK